MIDRKDYYHFGKFLKLHGFNGHLLLRAENSAKPKVKKPEPVFFDIEGILVPFFIIEFANTSGDNYLLLLEGVESEISAKEYIGCDVYLPVAKKSREAKRKEDFSALIGYKLFDSNRIFIGVIEEIIEIPQNNLFRVKREDREYLLPAITDLILGIEKTTMEIDYNLPEGLLDL
jgi:16S rRNA processing protein RimM